MPLRILFVFGTDFDGPSPRQLLGLAQQLIGRGHEVMMSIPGDIATASREGADRIPGLRVHDHAFRLRGLRHRDLDAARAFRPTLINAFQSRVPVIAACRSYARATGAPVFVHFEDDEWGLARGFQDVGLVRRLGWLARRVGARVHPPLWYLSTPASLRWVQRHAAGFDALTPTLAQHVEQRLGRPCSVVLPVSPDLRSNGAGPVEPGLPPLPGNKIVLYTGSIFLGNVSDVALAMRAVAVSQARGLDVSFVHTGAIVPPVDPDRLASEAGLRPGSAWFLGYLPFESMPAMLERATVLVQPGAPTEFNRLRLPSKLQAYLSSGTPTITFGIGFGELLEDRREVLKTHTAEPEELADRIAELIGDEALRRAVSEGGAEAARRLFDPARNTDALVDHYRRHLSGSRGYDDPDVRSCGETASVTRDAGRNDE